MSTPDVDTRLQDDSEIERLRRSLEDARQEGVRLLADFDNLRRRTGREQGRARQEGKGDVLRLLLPVLDSFDRAIEIGSSDEAFNAGMAATHRLLVDALRAAGAEPVESAGQPFDPRVHEAVATVAATDAGPGTVAREVRRGWRLGDDLLRPAQVVVAVGPEADNPWP